RAGRADARQDQGRARRATRRRPVHCGAHRFRGRRGSRLRHRTLPAVMEAGADMAKPMGVDTIADIKRVLREVGGPHMATLSQAAGPKARSLEELEAAGVCAATFPSVALFAAAQTVRNVVRLLKRNNSLAPCQEHLIPLDDYYELVGLKPLLAREESY